MYTRGVTSLPPHLTNGRMKQEKPNLSIRYAYDPGGLPLMSCTRHWCMRCSLAAGASLPNPQARMQDIAPGRVGLRLDKHARTMQLLKQPSMMDHTDQLGPKQGSCSRCGWLHHSLNLLTAGSGSCLRWFGGQSPSGPNVSLPPAV
jgi:hypothetical protein